MNIICLLVSLLLFLLLSSVYMKIRLPLCHYIIMMTIIIVILLSLLLL
ncbi:hypothetical protein N9L68_08590 [bacterium]|nr:hypothetical protein [bacterium]